MLCLASMPAMSATAQKVEVPLSQQWTMKSDTGGQFRILVAVPEQPAPPRGYPIIYVLDGNSAFGTVVDAVRTQSRFPRATGIEPAIVVGVGYPIDGPFDSRRRVFDLTVPTPASSFPPRPDGKPRSDTDTGGAIAFLDFIERQVKPAVQEKFTVDPTRQTLFGHSLGGLFTLHVLFNRPASFQTYIALSPSVWWKNRYILEDARRFVAARTANEPPVSLFVAAGSLEQDAHDPPETRMVDNAISVVDELVPVRDRAVRTQFHLVPDEHHRSIVPTVVSRALRFSFESTRAVVPAQSDVVLPGSVQRTMVSRTGKVYDIFISTPLASAPPGGWPVVYVLDGNAWFPSFAQMARLRGRRPDKSGVLPAVLVGVGYPGERPFDSRRRTWDFTPDAPLRVPNPAPGGQPWGPTGGATEFMSFLREELKSQIAREFKLDPTREILFGHSLGGLFTLHALFKYPDSFDVFVAASPSIWWNDSYVMDEARAFASQLAGHTTDRRLMIAMGAQELPHMVSEPKDLYRLLAPLSARGLEVELRELPEEEHVSAAPTAFNRLVDFALRATPKDIEVFAAMQEPDKDAAAPPIPTAQAYIAMTPEQRYQLRMQVRRLPPPARKAFHVGLHSILYEEMPESVRLQLHDERIAMDNSRGTQPIDE